MIKIEDDYKYLEKKKVKPPCYLVHDDYSTWGRDGVYFLYEKKTKEYEKEANGEIDKAFGKIEKKELIKVWVCSPIHIIFESDSEDEDNAGIVIRFKGMSKYRTICIPKTLFRGSGEEFRELMLKLGAIIKPKLRNNVIEYLFWEHKLEIVQSVTKPGWCDKNKIFVLHNKIIGSDKVFLQYGSISDNDIKTKGTLGEWKINVAELCRDNIILIASLGISFSAPLLKILNEEAGGVNWVGESSKGKTTTLNVARSIWGSIGLKKTWNTTANGVESTAELFNDMCLFFDELGQVDPSYIEDIVYKLGNGTGKNRMTEKITSRPTIKFRNTLISTGEKTLGTHLLQIDKEAKLGLSVRFLDIPCANRKYGVFDEIYCCESSQQYSDKLNKNTSIYYGTAIIDFLEKLIKIENELIIMWYEKIRERFYNISDTDLCTRVSKKFALYAFAIELAIMFKILPYEKGYGIKCMKEIFELWKIGNKDNQQGLSEDYQILEKVNNYILKYENDRFESRDTKDGSVIKNRSGWWYQDSYGDIVYLFTSEGLRSSTKGFDFKKVCDVLDKNKWITDKGKTSLSKTFRINNNIVRVYSIKPIQKED